jgi:DNA-binding Lrp family transcriptional regulator
MMNNTQKDKILDILRKDARIDFSNIAAMLGAELSQVQAAVAELEADGIIKGYTAIVDEERYDKNAVTAHVELRVTPQAENGYDSIADNIIEYREVDSVMLMSGGFDLLVVMHGNNFRDIAMFVTENLASMSGVVGTKTHFVLRRYKEKGLVFSNGGEDERLMVSP